MSVIDIHSTILVYGDGEVATTNPQRRFVDWHRHVSGVQVEQPSVREYVAQPGELLSIFSGVRTTLIDGTTAFSIALNTAKDGVYRIANTGGTAPAFRTARAVTVAATLLTLTVNNNATLEVSAAGVFGAVQVGDSVFVPGVATGDTSGGFNPNNVGFWTVIGAASGKITLRRRVGEEFNGVAESVTPAADTAFQVFSAAGVQAGDNLEISAGFSSVTQKSFVVSEVTASWVEFTSAEALPLETGITPTASGMTFYADAKRFIRVETDQEAVIRLNGDSGNSNRLSPRVSGDSEAVAHFEKWGPVWDLKVLNRSTTNEMVVTVISAE